MLKQSGGWRLAAAAFAIALLALAALLVFLLRR